MKKYIDLEYKMFKRNRRMFGYVFAVRQFMLRIDALFNSAECSEEELDKAREYLFKVQRKIHEFRPN